MLFDDLKLQLDNSSKEPKYNQLARQIEHYLSSKNIKKGTRLPSERLLSDVFGIAPMTVGRSLNELVKRGVLERRVGSGTYYAGPDRMRRIGILCHQPVHISDWYMGGILLEIYNSFTNQSVDFVSLVRQPEEYADTIREYQLDGIIVLAAQQKFIPIIQSLREGGFPIVSIGIAYQELKDICFGTDHFLSGIQATEYLISKGYKKIGILSGDSTGMKDRERGFSQSMYQNGLPLNPDWILYIDKISCAEDNIIKYLKSSDRPEALLIASHSYVVPIYNLIKKLGLRIPEDIAIVAFDNSPYAEYLDPALTVFEQPIQHFTHNAMVQLKNIMTAQKIVSFGPTPSILVERKSCIQKVS